jgi:Lon protease-like protein
VDVVSRQQRALPLFPLNIVLFPNAVLPIHVFEERYKLMVQRCLDADSKLGVVLIKSGSEVGEPAEPHLTGTLGGIVRVDRLDDGRMLISVAGEERFRILEITQRQPFLEGQVEVLEEDVDVTVPPEDMEAIRAAVTQHIRLLLGLRGGWVREATMPKAPVSLSYFVGSLVQSGLAEKQALLEETSTVRRLQTEMRLLESEAGALRERVVREFGQGRSRMQ